MTAPTAVSSPTLLEMAFAGTAVSRSTSRRTRQGPTIRLRSSIPRRAGLVLEYQPENEAVVFGILSKQGFRTWPIGAADKSRA